MDLVSFEIKLHGIFLNLLKLLLWKLPIGLTTYVCAAAVTERRLENLCELISRALQKLLIIIIIHVLWFYWTMSHSSLNHNKNMPYSVWKYLPNGSPQALFNYDYRDLAVPFVSHFHTGYSISYCDSMTSDLIFYWTTMEYAVFRMKISRAGDCSISGKRLTYIRDLPIPLLFQTCHRFFLPWWLQ